MSRPPADARLGRLLAIVPWIAARDGPTVEEVCRRFRVDEDELVADLNLLFLCGVHPFTPDVLVDVTFSDGRVWIGMADWFRRPLRLTPQEALALVSAGHAFLSLPGADASGALATALEKLETVLGIGPGEGIDVELAGAPPAVLDALREACRDRRKVRIGYYSYGRDGHSERVVQPWQVFNAGGQWYLSAWCEEARGERTFRVDRITSHEVTSDGFDPPARPGGTPAAYKPGEEDPVWVVDLDPPAFWVAESYPHDSVEAAPGGGLRVTFRSGEPAWVERILLRAGRHARVVQGDPSLASGAARRILARYRVR
ncbi:MAG TPA: WYL domain-containing protein [Acidimicrobiales bacterium]|nr:WYL domain-containing protein [Acidimicrobiales bacterium]